MWLLGSKDGKHWWQKRDAHDNWVPVTEEEAAAHKKLRNDIRDEIAAKILNDAFNKDPAK